MDRIKPAYVEQKTNLCVEISSLFFTWKIVMLKPLFIYGAIAFFFTPGFVNLPAFVNRPGLNVPINGEAPSMVVEGNTVHLSFSRGDSILYCSSTDHGQIFSEPVLVAVLNELGSSGGRGPQIICSSGQLLIAAPDKAGNFYTYIKNGAGNAWKKSGRINDVPGIAKEGFLSLGAGNNGHLFAAWLDLRNGKKNNIYGARSVDGGKTWQKNQLVYRSPEGSVCECCKPSVAMKGQQVAVMFRNNLKGNRDLYLVESTDGGARFGKAQKLGEGRWKLTGCPMDGGGLMIQNNNTVRTVWRREATIYTSEPGKPETVVATGRQCAIAVTGGAFYISFVNEGKVYCRKPDSNIVELGQGGNYPKLVAIDPSTILCAWEYENKIYRAIL